MKVYFYPNPCDVASPEPNPYSINFVDSLRTNGVEVTNKSKIMRSPLYDMIDNSGDADVYILNWVEDVGRHRRIRRVVLLLKFLYRMKRQGKRIVWVYHNIKSHYKYRVLAKILKHLLFKCSDLIITFSQKGLEILKSTTEVESLFYHHPINSALLNLAQAPREAKYDILIWGSVVRYKGIVEFLEFLHRTNNATTLNIFIVGKCRAKDADYGAAITALCNDNIVYEDRLAGFDEVSTLISQSKYVLFPYIVGFVSSSGALIDTIALNGNCIGPATGAFQDLEKEGVCLTYEGYEEIVEIIRSGKRVEQSQIDRFVDNNTWDSFAKDLSTKLLAKL